MDYQQLLSEALLIVEMIILFFLVYHTLKLEEYNESLFKHLEKLEEHISYIDGHVDTLDGHFDKLEEHSSAMDYHLRTIMEHSRIDSMKDQDRQEFMEGIEEYLDEREEGTKEKG